MYPFLCVIFFAIISLLIKEKKQVKRLLSAILAATLVVGGLAGCSSPEQPQEKELLPPEEKDFMELTVFNDDMLNAYLQPYWYTREIYNEPVLFVGEEGEATLMYEPSEVHSVQNSFLSMMYEEGKDYVIEGRTIRRVKGGNAPYIAVDDYFMKEPNHPEVVIEADPKKTDIPFSETRYLPYGEGTTFTSRQVVITYRTDEVFNGTIPQYQPEKLTNFLTKLQNKEELRIMVYGDSVAAGCNASGTSYGGNVNPYMPTAPELVKLYLEKNYDAKITLGNKAVGGWKVRDCINNYNGLLKDEKIDLLILRIGGNDSDSNMDKYLSEITQLLDLFFADHPEANVILQTPELPNQQSMWTGCLNELEDWAIEAVNGHSFSEQIAVAPVQTFTNWLEARGKRTRDWLSNNINHPNDFIIRYFAQVILKVMLGDEFSAEKYSEAGAEGE